MNDFSALKALKKEFEATEQQNAPEEKHAARSHTVHHRTREEEHARNIGIEKGMRVRLMDTSDEGIITAIGKDWYEVEIDGLPMRLVRSEFIIVNADEDRKMISTIPSKPKKTAQAKSSGSEPNGEKVIDLHFEKLPGHENVPDWAALEYQLDYFKRTIRENSRHKGKRIVFIHGDGDGILKAAIRKELDETFALSCTYSPASSDTFGTGATIVTVK